MKKQIALGLSLLFIVGCGGPERTTENLDKEIKEISKEFYVSSDNEELKLLNKYEVYKIKTGSSTGQSKMMKQTFSENDIEKYNRTVIASKKLIKSDFEPKRLNNTVNYNVGDERDFYIDVNGNEVKVGVLISQSNIIDTKLGSRIVNIWVSQESMSGNTCGKTNCINSDQAFKLQSLFLKSGLDNDIFDMETNILGSEWEETEYTNFISKSSQINIFIHDIDNDNSLTGGTIGYFYAKDLFKKTDVSGSNEMNLFYIDSQMFGNNTEFWDNKTYLTLVHEFEHMIMFYQRNLLLLKEQTTFVSELGALAMEDLLSNNLEITGPRGVAYPVGAATYNNSSDYRLFLSHMNSNMKNWSNTGLDYSRGSLFAAYLLRNSDPIKFYKHLVTSTKNNEDIVADAFNVSNGTNFSFKEIVHNFGIAITLSKLENLSFPYRMNFGDWDYTNIFKLGSINTHIYNISDSSVGELVENANRVTLISSEVTGEINISNSESESYIFIEKN